MRSIESFAIPDGMFDRPRPIYLRTKPEVPDFSNHSPCKIFLQDGRNELILDLDRDNISSVLGLLDFFVFNKDQTTALLTWNLKSLLSYCRHYIKRPISITTPITEIQVIENFLGTKLPAPKNILEAIERIKKIGENKSWNKVYKQIHLPLITEVLPALETFPLLNIQERCSQYGYYEIEGQKNGRLLSSSKFHNGYLPHTLAEADKAALKPRGFNLKFIVTDIRHCEVSVLQWLSNDLELKAVTDGDEDFYRQIYRIITQDDCNTENKRNMAKRIFLPVMYGAGAAALGKALKIQESVTKELIRRIHKKFPVSCQWLLKNQEIAANEGKLEDYFGRPRVFSEKPYTARNFLVQSVAATVCLEKLIELHKALQKLPANLCFSIHDGYGLVAHKDYCQETSSIITSVLESPSHLCKGLSLKTEVKIGDTLDNMSVMC